MDITAELRKYARDNASDWLLTSIPGKHTCSATLEDLLDIANDIDKAHAEAVAEALELHGGESHDSLADLVVGLEDTIERMESDWVKLPKDMDGVPIHVGDEMAFGRVDALVLRSDEWWYSVVGDDGFTEYECEAHRHVQPDSWERIIGDARKGGKTISAFGPSWEHGLAELVARCERLAGR